jgi:hypothetical protein
MTDADFLASPVWCPGCDGHHMRQAVDRLCERCEGAVKNTFERHLGKRRAVEAMTGLRAVLRDEAKQ